MESMKDQILELIRNGASSMDVLSFYGIDPSKLDPTSMNLMLTVLELLALLSNDIKNLNSSMEKMEDKVERMEDKVDDLNDTIKTLNTALTTKGKQNSTNSSLPPSMEGYSKGSSKDRSLREKSGKKPGGQVGHKGHGLSPENMKVDRTDEHKHYPKQCLSCPNFSQCIEKAIRTAKGTVYETETKMVEEVHESFAIQCPLSLKLLKAHLPEKVKSSQQYGISIRGTIVSLWAHGIVSIDRIKRLMKRRAKVNVSTGTIMNAIIEFAKKCKELTVHIKNYLKKAAVKHADETGMRANGVLQWLHTVCNDKATFLYADAKRGFKAIENGKLLIDATGILIHDCWSSYFKLGNLQHGICLQHIQRELKGAALRDKDQSEFFNNLEKLLLEMRKCRLDAIERGDDHIEDNIILDFRKRYDNMVNELLKKNPQPKKKKKLCNSGKVFQGKTRSLLLRLYELKDCVFLFLENFGVAYSNNCAEISVRGAKVRQAVSKCFRTTKGLEDYAHIMSVLDTGQKIGIDPSDMIDAVYAGTADNLLATALV